MAGRTITVRILAVLLAATTALIAAIGWWRLWMYHGWIGSPGFLREIWQDSPGGEASYETTFAEMFVISLVVVLPVAAILRGLQSRSRR